MSIPSRNAAPKSIEIGERTFFVTSKSIEGRSILQSDRMAMLLIDVLRVYVSKRKFKVHEFVVMPNHIHVLLTVGRDLSVEKAAQLIKGNFSYRAKRELGWQREIWQPGFSEVRVTDRESFLAYKRYIHENPVKAGLVNSPEEYPYCSLYLRKQKQKIKAAGRG
jgi:putative transposase